MTKPTKPSTKTADLQQSKPKGADEVTKFKSKVASKRRRGEEGFTLIELLVVIIIIGILAAVVVFAVGGIDDRGEESACRIDTRTLQTAQEANFAENGVYATSETTLVDNGFLSEESELHNIGPGVGTAPYSIRVANTQCGNNVPGASGTDDVVDGAHPGNS